MSDEIDAILATSRLNNMKVDVTGMLLFQDGSFVQYWEGPVTQRIFGEWSMGFWQNNSLPELQSFHFDLDALEKRLPEPTPTMVRTMMRTVFQTAR